MEKSLFSLVESNLDVELVKWEQFTFSILLGYYISHVVQMKTNIHNFKSWGRNRVDL